jgi:drug/metabolite transporter (DMT)-like permease
VPGLDPLIAGTACCIVSALGYTSVNICLRVLTDSADLVWVICIKELVTVVVVGPWLAYQATRGRAVLPPGRALVPLVLVGLVVQLGGNLGSIWAISVVGLAVTVPAMMGVMLASSAIMGWVFLREKVSLQAGAAIVLLVLSVVLLKLGTGGTTLEIEAGAGRVALAVAAACFAGFTYALLTVTIRKTVTDAVAPTSIVFVVTGVGVLSLGPLAYWRLGLDGLLATPRVDFGLMLLAGLLNLIAFLAITKGLQLTTIVRANVLNASQVAMSAVAGIVLFDEPRNLALALGIGLTIAGMILIERRNDG